MGKHPPKATQEAAEGRPSFRTGWFYARSCDRASDGLLMALLTGGRRVGARLLQTTAGLSWSCGPRGACGTGFLE